MPSDKSSEFLSPELRQLLLGIACGSIEYGLEHGEPLPISRERMPEPLQEKRATFVTLEEGGLLRGCIGSLEAERALAEDVVHNAFSAAFRDPRFPPVSRKEWPALDLYISVLSPPEPLPDASEEALVEILRPGIDGLLLEDGAARATFLPTVWENLPDPSAFVRHLKRKAGWPYDYSSPTLRAYRYTVERVAAEERG